MKKNQLPDRVFELLKPQGIGKKDILDVCPTDLSFESEYISGYLFLTAEMLGIVTSDPIGGRVRYFRGTKTKDMDYGEDTLTYRCRLIPLEETAHMRLVRQVATNLVMVYQNGEATRIAALTNLYLEQMNLFIKSYKKLKKYPEEPENVEASADIQEQKAEYCPICGTMYPDPKRKICPKCMNKRSIFIRTLKYFWKYRISFIVMFLCYFAAAGMNLVWPYLSGTILYDKVLAKDDGFLALFGVAGHYMAALILLVIVMLLSKLVQQPSGI